MAEGMEASYNIYHIHISFYNSIILIIIRIITILINIILV